MRYFYCTVTIRGTPGADNYYHLVQAKNVGEAQNLILGIFDFVSYEPTSIHIAIVTLSSMFTLDEPVRRLYLDK